MSQYLLLKRMTVQNANAVAGLTYGFPAITNFLGFSHALSRKLPKELGISLGGVMVISHETEVHARQPKGWGDYVFALTRNPLTKDGKTAPINEEGRMSMQVSLLIEINDLRTGDVQSTETFMNAAKQILPRMRLAGGQIVDIEKVDVSIPGEEGKMMRRLMPGSVLLDRHDYLVEHFEKNNDSFTDLFDAWCDFSKIKYQAIAKEDEPGKADWQYIPKPNSGYLVPIMAGYRAISDLYEPGKVDQVRDPSVPVSFVEAAYSIGEWISLHRIAKPEDAMWRYKHKSPWYLAKSKPFSESAIEPDLEQEMTF